jgi:hypothetical protein
LAIDYARQPNARILPDAGDPVETDGHVETAVGEFGEFCRGR